MSERCDVVVAYYRQEKFWPVVSKGLWDNREAIQTVFVVNDEPWGQVPEVPEGLHCVFLEHEHEGFGLCKSLNQGLAEVGTQYALIIEGDEVLPEGSVATSLACMRPGMLLCAGKLYVEPGEGHPFKVLEGDHRDRIHRGWLKSRPWIMCSGGHLMVDTEKARDVSFDEDYTEYGCHDYDFALRWHQAGGTLSKGGGIVLHLGSGKGKIAPKRAFLRFLSKLADHLHNRFHVGPSHVRWLPEYVNVGSGMAADSHYDWMTLDWVEDGQATELFLEDFLCLLTKAEAEAYVLKAAEKLRPGGELVVIETDVQKCARLLAEKPGHQRVLEALFPEGAKWAWDEAGVVALMRAAGLEMMSRDDWGEWGFRIVGAKEEA